MPGDRFFSHLPLIRSVVLSLSIALVLGVLAELRLFRLTNGLLFDLAVSGIAPGESRALVVRASPEATPQVVARLRAYGAKPVPVGGERSTGMISIPRPTFGITRRVVLANGSERLIRLPGDVVMPELLVRQLFDGSLPAGSLNGLDAVVGSPRSLDPPRYHVSGLSNARGLGAADFKARAIHALRTDRTAQEASGVTRIVALLAAAVLLPLTFAMVPPRRQMGTSLFVAGLLIIAGLLLVRFAGLLMPATELILLAMLAGTMAGLGARKERDRRFALLADRAAAFAARNSLLSDTRRWIDFFPAAARLTGVESSLILEAKGDGQFDVKAAFGPQTTRGAAGVTRTSDFEAADRVRPKPVRVDGLVGWSDARLARLDRAADAAIYWLYASPGSEDREAVLAAAERLAGHVAEQPGLAMPSRRSRRRHPLDLRLSGAMTAIFSRAAEFRSAFGALQTATMLFDAAGIPLQINPAMDRLLRAAGLQASRATPVDVATALAGAEADAAREMLGELVRYGGEIKLSSNTQIGGRRFEVRVTETAGDLLFEVIDVSDLHRLASIQNDLAGEIDARIRNDLEAIELATKLAADERLPADRRGRALAMVGLATKRTRSTLDELGRLVDASINVSEGEAYPINPRSALVQAVAALKPASDKAGVTVQLQQPALATLVLAEPELLDGLLRAFLEIILGDSPRGSTIHAILTEGEEESEVVVTGGFGLPAERFAAMLSLKDRSLPPPVQLIQLARERVGRWGGSLDPSSEAGSGYRFTLRLRKC